MSSKFSTIFENAGKVSANHQNTFVSAFLVGATFGGGQMFSSVWNCPCIIEKRATYTCLFTFAPAVLLVCLGFLLNNLTWRICQGFRSSKSHKCSWSCCADFSLITLRAFIPPAVWIIILALDGKYFVCYTSTIPCSNQSIQSTFGKESSRNSNQIIDENGHDFSNINDIQRWTVNSQIFGWLAFIVVVLVVTLGVCLHRYRMKSTFFHDRYKKLHQDIEHELFEEFMKKNAYLQADLNIQRFLARGTIKKEDWDSISVPPQRNVDPGEHAAYTPLQAWVYNSGKAQTACVGLNENSPKFQLNESPAPSTPNTVSDIVYIENGKPPSSSLQSK